MTIIAMNYANKKPVLMVMILVHNGCTAKDFPNAPRNCNLAQSRPLRQTARKLRVSISHIVALSKGMLKPEKLDNL